MKKQIISSDVCFDGSKIIKIGSDISYAIEELWKHNKVHRDIKPENIMYNREKNTYIPSSMGIDYLESPMKILSRQVTQTWEDISRFGTRMAATQVEVDFYNSIEEVDDSTITL